MRTSSLDTPIKRTGTPASLSRPWPSSMKLLLPPTHHHLLLHMVHARDMLVALTRPSTRISTQLLPRPLLLLLVLLLPLSPKGAVLQPGVPSPSPPPPSRRPRRPCLRLPPGPLLLALVAEALRATTRWIIRRREDMALEPRRRPWAEAIYPPPTAPCKGPCLRMPPACP